MKVVTVPELAADAGVSEQTIRNLITRGRIAAIKVGRDWHISVTAATRFLATYEPYDGLRKGK